MVVVTVVTVVVAGVSGGGGGGGGGGGDRTPLSWGELSAPVCFVGFLGVH